MFSIGSQTLGEEYLGLIQVRDQVNVQLSTLWQRFAWTCLESSGPLLLEQKLKEWKQSDERYYQRQTNTSRIPLIRIVASALLRCLTFGIIQRLHMAVFYLFAGHFYSIWKRVASIQYVTIRPQTDIRVGCISSTQSLNLDEFNLQNNRGFFPGTVLDNRRDDFAQRCFENDRNAERKT